MYNGHHNLQAWQLRKKNPPTRGEMALTVPDGKNIIQLIQSQRLQPRSLLMSFKVEPCSWANARACFHHFQANLLPPFLSCATILSGWPRRCLSSLLCSSAHRIALKNGSLHHVWQKAQFCSRVQIAWAYRPQSEYDYWCWRWRSVQKTHYRSCSWSWWHLPCRQIAGPLPATVFSRAILFRKVFGLTVTFWRQFVLWKQFAFGSFSQNMSPEFFCGSLLCLSLAVEKWYPRSKCKYIL